MPNNRLARPEDANRRTRQSDRPVNALPDPKLYTDPPTHPRSLGISLVRGHSQVDPDPDSRAAIAKLIREAAGDAAVTAPREFGSLKEALAADPQKTLFTAVVSPEPGTDSVPVDVTPHC